MSENVKDLICAVEGYDAASFAQLCASYDSVSKLEPFLVNLLVHVKKSLEKEYGEDEDVEETEEDEGQAILV